MIAPIDYQLACFLRDACSGVFERGANPSYPWRKPGWELRLTGIVGFVPTPAMPYRIVWDYTRFVAACQTFFSLFFMVPSAGECA